jgi:hypothetical protein
MNWREGLDGFQLNYHSSVNQEVHAIAALEFNVLVNHGRGLLALESDVPENQFASEALFVGRFQQTGSEKLVYLNRSSDDFSREAVLVHERLANREFTTEDSEKAQRPQRKR